MRPSSRRSRTRPSMMMKGFCPFELRPLSSFSLLHLSHSSRSECNSSLDSHLQTKTRLKGVEESTFALRMTLKRSNSVWNETRSGRTRFAGCAVLSAAGLMLDLAYLPKRWILTILLEQLMAAMVSETILASSLLNGTPRRTTDVSCTALC